MPALASIRISSWRTVRSGGYTALSPQPKGGDGTVPSPSTVIREKEFHLS